MTADNQRHPAGRRRTSAAGAMLHGELLDAAGQAIGSVEDLILDLETGEVRYLVVQGRCTRLGGRFQLHWQDVDLLRQGRVFQLSRSAHRRLTERGVLAPG